MSVNLLQYLLNGGLSISFDGDIAYLSDKGGKRIEIENLTSSFQNELKVLNVCYNGVQKEQYNITAELLSAINKSIAFLMTFPAYNKEEIFTLSLTDLINRYNINTKHEEIDPRCKKSSTTVLTNIKQCQEIIFEICQKADLPDGIIQLLVVKNQTLESDLISNPFEIDDCFQNNIVNPELAS